MNRLIRWIARVLLDPSLLYWVQLSTHDGGMVQVDKIGAGPLLLVTTGGNGIGVPLQEPDPAGLLFNATKDPDPAPKVVSMVALSPLPSGLPQRFTLVADFYLPENIGPWDLGVQWAPTVGIRSVDNPDDPNFFLAGATHQFRNLATDPNPGTVKIGLGAGNGPHTITPGPDLTDPLVAYPDASRQFTLETDIYLDQQKGWSRLRTPGQSWPERTWLYDSSKFPQVTGVGFGQAFATGSGFATVTATAFRIYSIRRRWLTVVLLGLLRQT